MLANFDTCLAREMVYEGGYSNNPKDPGGPTMKGVTQRVYNTFRAKNGQPVAAVSKINDNEVQQIYKSMYWDKIDGDTLADGVDFCIFDAAVNSGVGGATSWAQGALGIEVDGNFGQKTMDALTQACGPGAISARAGRRASPTCRKSRCRWPRAAWSLIRFRCMS
jgi:lysozyme family protein